MERYHEPDSYRQPDRNNLSEGKILEVLRSPEVQRELQSFREYLIEVESLVPRGLPATEQEHLRRDIHAEIGGTRPTDAGLPPVFPTVLHAGEHMDITFGRRASSTWPDGKKAKLVLDDKSVVVPSTPIGIIDFYRNMQVLSVNANLMEFSRTLVQSAASSLGIVAQECERRGRDRLDIEAFSGMSHLARLAGRLGFTVFEITNKEDENYATQTSLRIASRIAQGNDKWQSIRTKYKPARIAMISTRELTRKFGTSK